MQRLPKARITRELDLPTVEVIKETRKGQGWKFLPRTIGLLKKMPQSLLGELAETGKMRNELTAVLKRPRRQKGISRGNLPNVWEKYQIG